jgi:hypothetical protein
MVSRDYMLRRDRPPRSVKLTLDQVVIPAAIDAAAQVEAVAERLSNAVKRRPAPVLALVAFAAWLVSHRSAETKAKDSSFL